MSKHNHNNYTNPETNDTVIDKIPDVESVVQEEPNDVEPVYGCVVDCSRLNVRKKPTVNAEVLTTVPRDSELVLDLIKSNEKWYKVATISGVEGYCMKQYIVIKE